jgi:hypothetical protein
MEQVVNNGFRIKALNGDTFTEMRIENGRAIMYVYDSFGLLLDVLEEIACYIHPKDGKQIE